MLAVRPDDADANHLLGVILHQLGQFDASLTRMRRAREIDAKNPVLLANLGNLLRAMGRHPEAIEAFEAGLALTRKLPSLHCGLGICHREAGRIAPAMDCFRAALALNPRYAEAYYNLGLCFGAAGRSDQAAGAFESALAIAPSYPNAWENLGTALFLAGRNGSAITALEKAIAQKPTSEAYRKLGLALNALELNARALEAFDHAIVLDAANASLFAGRAKSLAGLGRLEEALESIDRAAALDSEDKLIPFAKGIMLGEYGRPEESAAAYEAALRLDADWGEPYRLIAWSHKQQEGSDFARRAQAAYDRSAPDGENRKHLAFALAKIEEDGRTYREAFDHLVEGNRIHRRDFAYSTAETERRVAEIGHVFSPELFARFKGRGHASDAPIFIIGMPRSGTTLIESILAGHRDVTAGGETFPFGAAAQKAGLSPGVHPPPYRFGDDLEICRKTGESYLALAGERLDAGARFTDKLPMNFFYAGLIHLALPDAKIIHCRRQPLDTCLSIFKNYLPSPTLGYSCDLTELGAHYRLYLKLMEHWESVMPGVIHHVDYEEVVGDPERHARALLAHCGLDWDASCLDFHASERRVRTTSSHQVRSAIYKSSVSLFERYGDALAPLIAALEGETSPS